MLHGIGKDGKFGLYKQLGVYLFLFLQYKDAFFSANPNFKWYKLPAPPLRTLTTRPCNMSPNQDYVFDFSPSHYEEPLARPERQRHDSYSMSNGKVARSRKSSAGVGQFKLADETQMGGLSSLLNASDSAVQNDDGKCGSYKVFVEVLSYHTGNQRLNGHF